jgi:hypothetical protein
MLDWFAALEMTAAAETLPGNPCAYPTLLVANHEHSRLRTYLYVGGVILHPCSSESVRYTKLSEPRAHVQSL